MAAPWGQAPTLEFKAMMFSLTQVEPERQKVRGSSSMYRQPTSGEPAPDARAPPPPQIMVKGTIVKDDENWSKYKLKEKMMLCAARSPRPPRPPRRTLRL